jgi:hypothetical protein
VTADPAGQDLNIGERVDFTRAHAAGPPHQLRRMLGVAGETVWQMPPLGEDDALALFLERASLVRPGFTLDASSEAAVRTMCRRLDGIPLALEALAALAARAELTWSGRLAGAVAAAGPPGGHHRDPGGPCQDRGQHAKGWDAPAGLPAGRGGGLHRAGRLGGRRVGEVEEGGPVLVQQQPRVGGVGGRVAWRPVGDGGPLPGQQPPDGGVGGGLLLGGDRVVGGGEELLPPESTVPRAGGVGAGVSVGGGGRPAQR